MSQDASSRMTACGQLEALNDRLEARTGTVAVGEIVDCLGRSGIGMTLLILSLPALIPIPGPIGLIFGSAVILVGLQLGLGADRLLLPSVIRSRELPVLAVRTALTKTTPLLRRVERVMKPRRLLPLTGALGRMALGFPLILMGAAIVLPVPLGNILPVISLIVLSLGLTMRDGVAVLMGLVLAGLALFWFALLFVFGAEMLDWLWGVIA